MKTIQNLTYKNSISDNCVRFGKRFCIYSAINFIKSTKLMYIHIQAVDINRETALAVSSSK